MLLLLHSRTRITGNHIKWDQILLVKTAKYIGFCVHRRSSCLPWSPVILIVPGCIILGAQQRTWKNSFNQFSSTSECILLVLLFRKEPLNQNTRHDDSINSVYLSGNRFFFSNFNFLSSGGLVKIKLKLTTLPRYRVVCQFRL